MEYSNHKQFVTEGVWLCSQPGVSPLHPLTVPLELLCNRNQALFNGLMATKAA